MQFDIVIAGGGFAGATCARELARRLGPGAIRRVALIAERNVLVFQPMLAEVVGSTLSPLDVVVPLRQFCRKVSVLQGSVRRVDWKKRELMLDGGRFSPDQALAFTHLVLALGSVAEMGEVPGMAKHGWPLKDVTHALRLRAALINRLEEANLADDPVLRRRLLSFVVVGGGYTGVEVAGQITDFLRASLRFYANLRRERPRVTLVHGGPHLLPEIGQRLGEYAERVLRQRGVELRLKTRVAAIEADRVRFEGGGGVEAHTVVTTIGNGPHPVVLDLCRQLGLEAAKGRVPTDETLRVAENLWAAGDCASVPWTDRGKRQVAPPTAQFALQEGRLLARNLAAVLGGGRPQPFRYHYRGQLATVGERAAVAEIYGMHFRGFLAWWLWRTIYLAKLPTIRRRLRVTVDWTFDLVFPRDLSVLVPHGDEPGKS